ncbi:MAG: hypothetical protein ABR607_14305 [Pyrinomonadaceae bacterium]
MCINDNLEADRSSARKSPIQFLTENGFSIVRQWEAEPEPPPADGPYTFIVSNATGEKRRIGVAFTDDVVERTKLRTAGRVGPGSDFWIYCAERCLANHLWENDAFPTNDTIRIEASDREDLLLALRWDRL